MHRHIYKAIKDRVEAQVSNVNHFEWDTGQYLGDGKHEGFSTPAIFIRFDTIETNSIGKRIQMGVQPFTLTLVIDTAKSPREVDFIANESVAEEVRAALTGWTFEDSAIVLSNFRRTGQAPDTNPGSQSKLGWNYTCMVKDLGSQKQYTTRSGDPLEILGVDVGAGSQVVTAITVTNPNSGTLNAGDNISAISLTSNNPCTFYVPNLPAGMTLTQSSPTTASIIGTAPSATIELEIVAIGTNSGSAHANTSITVGAGTLWTPLDLGDDLFLWIDPTDATKVTKSGEGVTRIDDSKPSSTIYIERNDVSGDDPFIIPWPYDPAVDALLPDYQNIMNFVNTVDLSEDYRIYCVCFPSGFIEMIGGQSLNTQNWQLWNLNNSYRNYPNNEALSATEWFNALNGAGIFEFNPGQAVGEDARTTKNDGSKYTTLHNSSNGMHVGTLSLSSMQIMRGDGVFGAFIVTKPLSNDNKNNLLGWALHRFSLPKSEWDSGFVHYNNAPVV